MLEFREIDYSKDIPEIVDLLRTSLSETNDKEHFLWKHYKNPFGKSYGLLAFDEEKIVGVRMFMFWDFYGEGEIVKAIRPVDTITDPDYRGKGIFKKLTLQGLEDCQGKFDIIFNTPNKNSKPGYLKMGWKEYPTPLIFKVALVLPFTSAKIKIYSLPVSKLSLTNLNLNQTGFHTHVTKEFIHWRYKDPVYKAAVVEIKGKEIIIIYRTKTIKAIRTLVIMEVLGNKDHRSLALRRLCFYLNIYTVYYLGNKFTSLKFRLSGNRDKPVVVYRDDEKGAIDEIHFSAGDLEGRL
jgi:GNAT superfamily N-acetyltransferase